MSKWQIRDYLHENYYEIIDKSISLIRNSPPYLRAQELKMKKRRKSFTGKHLKRLTEIFDGRGIREIKY